MARIRTNLKFYVLWLALAVSLTSCFDYENDRELCDYKVQLRYDYNEENSTSDNRIEYWVQSIDEYIFDEAGVLYQSRRFEPDACTEHLNSNLDLSPGRYSVIAVGNVGDRSVVSDAQTGRAPEAGKTRRQDLRLTPDHYESFAGGTKGPCEELFHGYKTFTVKPEGISRVRVDMINAHFQLRFRVTWKYNTTPDKGNYYALLESIPSQYSLMPEYIYPIGSFECRAHVCEDDDYYPSNCNNVIHHIPYTCYGGNNVQTHRNDTYINADNELWGQFVNYRIKTDTKPVLRIFSDGGTRGLADTQIVRDIDLQAYFQWYHYELDHTLKQEYELDIVVDGTTITVTPMRVGDWDEGGPL